MLQGEGRLVPRPLPALPRERLNSIGWLPILSFAGAVEIRHICYIQINFHRAHQLRMDGESAASDRSNCTLTVGRGTKHTPNRRGPHVGVSVRQSSVACDARWGLTEPTVALKIITRV